MRAIEISLAISVLGLFSGCNPNCEFDKYRTCELGYDVILFANNAGSTNSAKNVSDVRFDFRAKQPPRIRIGVRRATELFPVVAADSATPPILTLTVDGTTAADVNSSRLQTDSSDDAYALQYVDLLQGLPRLGALEVKLHLQPVQYFPPAMLPAGAQRVYVSPSFDAARKTELPRDVRLRNGFVRRRLSVQVAPTFAGPGLGLFTTEQGDQAGSPVPTRWLELYRAMNGGAGFEIDPSKGTWPDLIFKIDQRTQVGLITVTKDVVVSYDFDTSSGRKDIFLFPYYNVPRPGQSQYEAQIPSQATGLAACAEERIFALALANEVRYFGVDLSKAIDRGVYALGTRAVPGVAAPVMAMRDVAGAIPMQRSQKYLSAVADATGQISLLPILGTGTTATLDFQGVTTVARDGIDRALALADLDSDGLQDIVYATADGQLGWVPQQPDGSFGAAASLNLTVQNASSLSVGDLNGDGVPDLAVATTEAAGGTVTVFWNQSN